MMTVRTDKALAAVFALAAALVIALPAVADDYKFAASFGTHSIRGDFAFTMAGSFSSAPPPFVGDRENFAFSRTGRYHFDGKGGVTGEFSLVFENATSGGNYSAAVQIGTYEVTQDGRMIIEFQNFRGDMLINEETLDCVIAKRRRLVRCIVVRLISFQQGPTPVPLPVTGLGAFERQW